MAALIASRTAVTMIASLALAACVTQPTRSSDTSAATAIHAPPIRSGQETQVAYPRDTARVSVANLREEVAVLGTLHRFLDANVGVGCLNPLLAEGDVEPSLRKAAAAELRSEAKGKITPAAVRERLIADQRGSWGSAEGGTTPLPSPLERAIVETYADAAMTVPRKRLATALTKSDVPNTELRKGCGVSFSRPAIHRGWAFVDHSSTTVGHLYALRHDADGWKVVGRRLTYII